MDVVHVRLKQHDSPVADKEDEKFFGSLLPGPLSQPIVKVPVVSTRINGKLHESLIMSRVSLAHTLLCSTARPFRWSSLKRPSTLTPPESLPQGATGWIHQGTVCRPTSAVAMSAPSYISLTHNPSEKHVDCARIKTVGSSECLSLQFTARRPGFTERNLHRLWTVIKERLDNLLSAHIVLHLTNTIWRIEQLFAGATVLETGRFTRILHIT